MSLQWIVNTVSGTQVDDVNTSIAQCFAGLQGNTNALNSVKVTTSDMNHGNAWGIVVWCPNTSTPPMPNFTKWNLCEFPPCNTNYQDMFDALGTAFNTETLPSGDQISFNQLYFSQISMTNRAHGDATLTLFYPSI